jgi:hypothetical protein
MCVDATHSLVLLVVVPTHVHIHYNAALVIPGFLIGHAIQSYQTYVGTLNEVLAEAQILFPYTRLWLRRFHNRLHQS